MLKFERVRSHICLSYLFYLMFLHPVSTSPSNFSLFSLFCNTGLCWQLRALGFWATSPCLIGSTSRRSMEEHRQEMTAIHPGVLQFGVWGSSPNIFVLISRMVSGALIGFCAFGGAFMGSLSGVLVGRVSDTGILRGASMGAIAGAVLSIEILEAYRAYWRSDQSRFPNTSMRSFVDGLFHDRFLPHQISSATLVAYHLQVREIYGDVAMKGLSGDLLKKLPSFVIPDAKTDALEESICCIICLQDIVGGETARRLPLCFHTFHLSCVDKWLAVHGSCPLCRQYV